MPANPPLKVVAIVQARMSSTRLPGKVLKPIEGEPLLEILFDRLKKSALLHQVVLATTKASQDDPIVNFAQTKEIPVYRGSEDDVLSRYYEAAKAAHADVIVRLTADCPMLDPEVVDTLVSFYLDHHREYDYIANTAPPPGTYPEGMDVEVFSFRALEKAWREARKYSDREHVTFYFWKNPDRFRTFRLDHEPDLSDVRVTVDYDDDFEFLKRMIRHFKQNKIFGSMQEIADYARANGGHELRRKHEFGAGWTPSLLKDGEANADGVVSLRRLDEKTLSPRAHEWLNDPEVKKHLFNVRHHEYNREDCVAFMQEVYQMGRPHWGIFVDETHVGNISAHKWCYPDRWIDLTFLVGDRAYWGCGVGRRALGAATHYCFDKGFHRVQCGVFAPNLRAITLLEKLGFQQEGVSRETIALDDRYLDVVHMAVLAPQWRERERYRAIFVEDIIDSHHLLEPVLDKRAPIIY